MSDEQALGDILEDTRRTLRANLEGELQFDEHLRPVKIVIGHDGRIVGPVMVAMLESANTVLFLPHAEEDALQVLITLEKFDEQSAFGHLCDRWRIYHGEPEDVRWAFFHVDAVRYRGAIIDGDAVCEQNPLAGIESRLCREVNQNRKPALAALIRNKLNLEIDDPVMVGIDPYGIDVRGPFDIIRIGFDERIDDPGRAEALVLQELLAG